VGSPEEVKEEVVVPEKNEESAVNEDLRQELIRTLKA
jgi:hypothetical protein